MFSEFMGANMQHYGGPEMRPRLKSRQVSPRVGAVVGAVVAGTPRGHAGHSDIGHRRTPSGEPQKEKLNVQIVEKKGDVVVWGPANGRNRQGARLPRIICYGDINSA